MKLYLFKFSIVSQKLLLLMIVMVNNNQLLIEQNKSYLYYRLYYLGFEGFLKLPFIFYYIYFS